MRLTPEQALQRILATEDTKALRVAKKPPTLSKTLRNVYCNGFNDSSN